MAEISLLGGLGCGRQLAAMVAEGLLAKGGVDYIVLQVLIHFLPAPQACQHHPPGIVYARSNRQPTVDGTQLHALSLWLQCGYASGFGLYRQTLEA